MWHPIAQHRSSEESILLRPSQEAIPQNGSKVSFDSLMMPPNQGAVKLHLGFQSELRMIEYEDCSFLVRQVQATVTKGSISQASQPFTNPKMGRLFQALQNCVTSKRGSWIHGIDGKIGCKVTRIRWKFVIFRYFPSYSNGIDF